ncbi:hypothetical protein EYF80_057615 [Liparis tanakae]|uniref:Uncharacterized protein n=1 Tax=Liparis tanakae TaxID=230148 RepID=A0A4Z2ETJ0_9TELE|nr:hypothetical protein EYF80_057615 [Liparis tanakae]
MLTGCLLDHKQLGRQSFSHSDDLYSIVLPTTFQIENLMSLKRNGVNADSCSLTRSLHHLPVEACHMALPVSSWDQMERATCAIH